MVDFKDLATQYVLSDDDSVMEQAALQAAAGERPRPDTWLLTSGISTDYNPN